MSAPIEMALGQARILGDALIRSAKAELGETIKELRQREVEELEEAGKDLGKLIVIYTRQLANPAEDKEKATKDEEAILREIAHAKARVANWTWVGADKVRARWAAWLEQAGELAGKALKAVGKGLVA